MSRHRNRFTDNNLAQFDRQIYGDYSQGDPRIYGNYINAINAFNKSYNNSTRGRGSDNPVGSVKTQYEKQLSKYINQLPEDVDLAAIPEKYRNNISTFLMKQKQEYVNAANVVDEYEVGSEGYMQTVSKMNTIRASFERLDAQMKAYGSNKKNIIEDIENQSISLYGENEMNANLLRGVYNEEYDLNIDEFGNIAFQGDDGVVKLDDLPSYEPKDYKVAQTMMDMGVQAYKNGVVLKPGDIMYQNYRNKLNIALDQGGVPTLMSVIHDGLVGDTKMIDDPNVAQAVTNYNANQIGFEQLRDIVVNRYMGVIQQQSKTGYKVKQEKTNPPGNPNSVVYNAPEDLGYHSSGGKMFAQTIRGTNQGETYYIDPSTGAKVMLNQKEKTKPEETRESGAVGKVGLGPVYGGPYSGGPFGIGGSYSYIPNKGQGDNPPAQTEEEKEIARIMEENGIDRNQAKNIYDGLKEIQSRKN